MQKIVFVLLGVLIGCGDQGVQHRQEELAALQRESQTVLQRLQVPDADIRVFVSKNVFEQIFQVFNAQAKQQRTIRFKMTECKCPLLKESWGRAEIHKNNLQAQIKIEDMAASFKNQEIQLNASYKAEAKAEVKGKLFSAKVGPVTIEAKGEGVIKPRLHIVTHDSDVYRYRVVLPKETRVHFEIKSPPLPGIKVDLPLPEEVLYEEKLPVFFEDRGVIPVGTPEGAKKSYRFTFNAASPALDAKGLTIQGVLKIDWD